jgi:L-threonylcarbamoyladenylate synthase
MPENKIALNLIKKTNRPLAAPSANLSGKPSPTEAKHVYEDLNGKIAGIIDGGKTKIGIESTVVDLTSKIPIILRPGQVTKKQLEKILGQVQFLKKQTKKVKSPGMKYLHYSPKAKVILLDTIKYKKIINSLITKKTAILSTNKKSKYKIKTIYLGSTPKQISKNLFSSFRELDALNYKTIIIEPIGKTDEWEGIKNRLVKASWKIIKG